MQVGGSSRSILRLGEDEEFFFVRRIKEHQALHCSNGQQFSVGAERHLRQAVLIGRDCELCDFFTRGCVNKKNSLVMPMQREYFSVGTKGERRRRICLDTQKLTSRRNSRGSNGSKTFDERRIDVVEATDTDHFPVRGESHAR